MQLPSNQKSISHKIIRNTIFNIIGRIWCISVAFILTPYCIGHIGVERFGIWAIVGGLTAYFGLLDFGISASFVKYIAEYHTKNDYEKINQVVNTGFIFYSVFAIFIFVLGYLLINPLLVFFHIPPGLFGEVRFVFLLGIIIFGVSNALSPFGAIQTGLQQMDIFNKVAIAVTAPQVIGTVFFLEAGYGLPGLMVNNAILLVISSLINIIIAFRILPELRFNPFLFTKEMFRKLFGFGYQLQISRFTNLISFHIDKLLITYFLGLGLVTFYQLGSSIIQGVRTIVLILISALVPAVSEIEAKESKDSLRELYIRGSKYLILVSTPFLFLLITNAHLIILGWMGEGYDKAALVMQVLAFGYFTSTVTGVAISIATGVARTEFEMKSGIFLTILNILLNVTLIIKIGFIGVIIGSTISLCLASLFFMKMFHNYSGIALNAFIQLFYKPVFACIIPSLITIILSYTIYSKMICSGRIINLCLLGLNCIIFTAIYIFFILLLKALDEYDWNLLKTKIPLLKSFGK